MTKMIKLSLVAAVAVAGLTTTASAVNLEDAIKGVQVSGFVLYRANKTMENGTALPDPQEMSSFIKTRVVIKSPVNDTTTAKIVVADDKGTGTRLGEANFIIKTSGATLIAGRQAIPTPFMDGSDQKGDGLVALIPAGGVTIAAGYFYAPLSADNDLMALGAIGKAGTVSYQAWYASLDNETQDGKGADTKTGLGQTLTALMLNAKVAGLNVEVVTATSSSDAATSSAFYFKDQSQSRVVVSGKANKLAYRAGVVVTGKDGGDVRALGKAGAADSDAKVNFSSAELDASGVADATLIHLGVNMPIANKLSGDLSYTGGSVAKNAAGKDSVVETTAVLKYASSKNFYISGRYTTGDVYGADFTKTRIEMKYTF